MKKLFWIFVILLTVVSAVKPAAAADDFIRYKVTVTVTTPEGEKTGSAVREAGRHSETRVLPQQGGITYNIGAGEAVVVDLGKRGVLFATMGGEREAKNAFNMLSDKDNKGRIPLPHNQYPFFVNFGDMNDPKSVKAARDTLSCSSNRVECEGKKNGYVPANSMTRSFGEGVSVKGVSIELTNERVTRGIERWLPWVPRVKMHYLDGGDASASAPLGLEGSQFQVGDK